MTYESASLPGFCLTACSALLAPEAFAEIPSSDKSAFSLFNPTPEADLRSFGTDRPPKANGPYTIDAGHFQYETDLAVYSEGSSAGRSTTSWTLIDPTLKLGLTNSVDLEIQVTPYERLPSASGAGDTYLKVKFNLQGNDGGDFALALMPYWKIPSASSGLGNGAAEGGLIVPMTFNVPHGFTVVVMPQWDWLKNASGSGYDGAADFLINVSHALYGRWTLYMEIFTTQYVQRHVEAVYTADAALTCLIRPNLQLDFGLNQSLNSVNPRTQLYAGISQRF